MVNRYLQSSEQVINCNKFLYTCQMELFIIVKIVIIIININGQTREEK